MLARTANCARFGSLLLLQTSSGAVSPKTASIRLVAKFSRLRNILLELFSSPALQSEGRETRVSDMHEITVTATGEACLLERSGNVVTIAVKSVSDRITCSTVYFSSFTSERFRVAKL